jgi:hypothetical protein
VRIVQSTPDHAEALGRTMRARDALEVTRLGFEPHAVAYFGWRVSDFTRTALVDGQVAAIWGVVGNESVGVPWLLTAPPCEAVSALTFVRIYRAQAAEMLQLFPKLENYVDASYIAAVRLVELAGFTLDEAKPYGEMQSPFHRFEMVAA